MRICLSDAFDRMNPGQDQRRQRILVGHFYDSKNIRLAPAGIDRLDLFDFAEGRNDVARLAGQDVDEDIRAIRHSFSPRDLAIYLRWARTTVEDANTVVSHHVRNVPYENHDNGLVICIGIDIFIMDGTVSYRTEWRPE